jgi:hypothetical protein
MKRVSLNKVMAKLADEPKRVQLAAMQDADALYNKLVKGAQAQASILMKVENELKSLSGTAQELQKVEQKLESMAKELGVDLDTNYAADTWVKDLSKYANEVGLISSKL